MWLWKSSFKKRKKIYILPWWNKLSAIRQWQTVIQKFLLREWTGALLDVSTVTAPPCDAQLDQGVSPFLSNLCCFQNPTVLRGRSPLRITSTTTSGGNPTVCTGFQVCRWSRAGLRGLLLRGFLSLLLRFIFADREYLHKEPDGNVFLHNVETKAESLYLSNSTFVRHIWGLHFVDGGRRKENFGLTLPPLFHRIGSGGRHILSAVGRLQIRGLWKQLHKGRENVFRLKHSHRCKCEETVLTEGGWHKVLCLQQRWRHSFTSSYSIYDRETS